MAFAAAEVLGTTLRASRAGYGLYEADSDLFVMERDWNAPGIASVAGRHRLAGFGIATDQLARGELMAVADAVADPRMRDHAEALSGMSARAVLNMPVLEGGRLVALFFITQRSARRWAAAEIDFVRDVADRTRAAVERRRAEAELRTLNATLERKVEERTRERDRVWRNAQDMIVVIDARGTFCEVNPAVAKVLGWTPEDMIGCTVFASSSTRTCRRPRRRSSTPGWRSCPPTSTAIATRTARSVGSLEDLGYAAIEAEDGPSGLKVLRGGARIDLLVTDVGLPGGMNGRQMADAARVLRPGLKVLYITGYAENAVVGNGHLDPGMAVLTKPFAMDDLARKIRELIAK